MAIIGSPHSHPVLRICDILVRIRIRGSVVPLANGSRFESGSGSGYFRQWPPWWQLLPITYFLKLNLHHFSKIKSHKEATKQRKLRFSYYFCLIIEGSGSRRPKTYGSCGSGSATLFASESLNRSWHSFSLPSTHSLEQRKQILWVLDLQVKVFKNKVMRLLFYFS